MSNFTVVTGFFDIGRDKWKTKHARSNETYFRNIKNMMSMDVNLIVFTESKNLKKFKEFRRNKQSKTYFVEMEFSELEMYPYIEQMEKCQKNPIIMSDHPDKTCPEYQLPEYNTIVNSKFGLLSRAVKLNPFKTDFFCWIDAGYTHCTINLENKKYEPTILYNFPYTITFSQLLPTSIMVNGHYPFFIQHIDVVSAGFFFGKSDTILRFQQIYHDYYTRILYEEGISDDEQYYLALLLREQPTLFNPIFMDWFGSLKLT